jgi:hypothetical protein
MRKLVTAALAAIALLATPLYASAQQEPMPSSGGTDSISRSHTARGVITNIDKNNSLVTIRTDQGREVKVEVEPETAQKLKKGDQIELDVTMKLSREEDAEKK